ncbi:restriction endonuclease subunit S, partial [Streptococcus danieliae]|nr:restriction endonuclease subunit S [Streptococcus danieliae]
GGEWRKTSVDELFEINSSKKIFHANQLSVSDVQKDNTYPYVVRSALNNGIRGYIEQEKKYLNPEKTLSFAQDTFTVFYQEQPYFTGNKVKVLRLRKRELNREIAMFFVSICEKTLGHLTWGTGSTVESIKNIKINVPYINNKVAYEYMEDYVKTLEAERI